MREKYITFEKDFIKARYVENTLTKQKLELNGNIKILYKYIFDRYSFFNSIGKEFYDNQENIAESIAMSKRFVMEAQKGLILVGLVDKKTTRQSNSYIVHNVSSDRFKLVSCSNAKTRQNILLDVDDEEF